MTKVLYVTSHDPSRWVRHRLVEKAIGEHNLIIKYVPPPNLKVKILKTVLWGYKILLSYFMFHFNHFSYDGIIFLNPYPLGWVAIHTPFFHKKPILIDYMDVSLDEELSLPRREAEVLEESEGVVFWSKALMNNVRKEVSLKEYTYIPAGVEDEILHKLSKAKREFYCYPYHRKIRHKDEKIIMYFGHLWRINGIEVQGIYDLIKAMSILEKEYKNLRLILSGVIPDSELLRFLRKTNINANKVIFLKPVSYGTQEFICRLVCADILVLPTTSHVKIRYAEQHKLFIYMATKIPIVATATPGTLGVLNESMAKFAKPDDPESLARAIAKVLENPDLARKMAERAFKHLVSNYTWKILSRKYRDFISKVLT